jgi:hypothetical protein
MDITMLARKWRAEAEQAGRPPGQWPGAPDVLNTCADELELAYHQDRHDAEFHSGCRFCDWEREHNDNYPDGG